MVPGILVDTVRGNVVIPRGVAGWMWEKFFIVRILTEPGGSKRKGGCIYSTFEHEAV